MKKTVHVTDHAVLRYLERVGGFAIDPLRKNIQARLQPYADMTRGAVVIDGYHYVLVPNADGRLVLTTVLAPEPERTLGIVWK